MGCPARALALAVLSLAAGAAGAPPGRAHACVTATAYVAGDDTPSGPHCLPVLDEWSHLCPVLGGVQAGYGAVVAPCVPKPPVTSLGGDLGVASLVVAPVDVVLGELVLLP
jgi:hypothetical protein